MGAQKAAAKPIQEISVSNLSAVTTVKWTMIFCFFLLCPKVQTHFPRLTSDFKGDPQKKSFGVQSR